MVSKSNQSLKSFDLVGMMFLMVIVVGISTVIISREMRDIDQSMGLAEAENLAFQLIHGGFAPAASESSRGPASIKNPNEGGNEGGESSLGVFNSFGEIGRDPWDQAFRYKVLKDEEGMPTHVVVWSYGPNGAPETPEEALRTDSEGAVRFAGDDLGYVHTVMSRR